MNVVRYTHNSHHPKKYHLPVSPPQPHASLPSATNSKKNKLSSSPQQRMPHSKEKRPMLNDSDNNNNDSSYQSEEYDIMMDMMIVEEGERRVLIFCSIPLICISIISLFHLIVDHAPFFNGDCRGVNCVAGSGEQFAVWTIIFLLSVYGMVHFIYYHYQKKESKAQERLWASA